MASQGPLSGGTFANDTGVGSVAWTSPSSAASADGTSAQAYLNPGVSSNYLKATNFGFSIPAGATIDGIVVDIRCDVTFVGPKDSIVKLVKGGVIGGSSVINTGYWSDGGPSYLSHGGSTNLWGNTFTDSDINSSGFGVAVSAIDASIKMGSWSFIDHIRITVYYTSTGGGSTASPALLLAGN